MDSYQIAVGRGVSLLDREVPDWRSRVDIDALDMSNLDGDLLCQLFGSYLDGLHRLGVPTDTADDVTCGFDAPLELVEENAEVTYQALTDEWKRRVKGVSL